MRYIRNDCETEYACAGIQSMHAQPSAKSAHPHPLRPGVNLLRARARVVICAQTFRYSHSLTAIKFCGIRAEVEVEV